MVTVLVTIHCCCPFGPPDLICSVSITYDRQNLVTINTFITVASPFQDILCWSLSEKAERKKGLERRGHQTATAKHLVG